MRWMKVLATVVTCAAVGLAWRVSAEMPARVRAGEQSLRWRECGTGDVTVVFEIGLGGVLEEWAMVEDRVAGFARTAAYDRVGSRLEGKLTGREVAETLHAALAARGIRPPYVMVGQSFGGIYCRVFAEMYPDEVAGLVLVDPSQEGFIKWLRQARPELNNMSSADLREWPALAGMDETLEQVEAGQLPGVPVTVITGMLRGRDKQRDALLPKWWEMHEEWVRGLPQGRHVAAERAGHGVQVEEPGVIVEEIRRVVERAQENTARKRAG